MLRSLTILAYAVCLLSLAPAPAAADVQLTMQDGRVSLTATNATVREILEKWAEVGHTTIINGERLTGGPITVELSDVPEAQALAVILRAVSGYIAAPRPTAVANLSQFDRIHVLPTSSAPRSTPGPTAAFPQPQFAPPFDPQDALDPALDPFAPPEPNPDDDPAQDFAEPPVPRGPVFGSFPRPVRAQPRVPATTPQTPPFFQPGGLPAGVAVPGMVVPTPEQAPGSPNRTGGLLPVPEPAGR